MTLDASGSISERNLIYYQRVSERILIRVLLAPSIYFYVPTFVELSSKNWNSRGQSVRYARICFFSHESFYTFAMAYVNIAEWKADQVCEWLKGTTKMFNQLDSTSPVRHGKIENWVVS